jgi:hypothetical protein
MLPIYMTCPNTFHRHAVQPLVSGVSGACFRRHPSQAAAEAAFAKALEANTVVAFK